MQRQSFSPGSKNHRTTGGNLTVASPDSDDELKADKLIRSSSGSSSSSSSSSPSRTVHLIPILTLLCILILYLISHEPSPLDLPRTRGIDRILDQKAAEAAESVSSIVSAAIRNKRGLMEETRIRSRRLGIP